MSTMLVSFSMTSGEVFSLKRQILQCLLLTYMTRLVKLQHLDEIESKLRFGIVVVDELLVKLKLTAVILHVVGVHSVSVP